MNTVPLPRLLTWMQPYDFRHKLGVCDRIFGQSIAGKGICWVRTAAGISWKLDLANPTHRWIVYGKYEGSPFLNWAKDYLRPDAVVVDSGANIGQMLLYLAQWVPDGKLLAFEPGTEQADWLEECLKIHSDLPVEVIRLGLGAVTKTGRLNGDGPSFVHGAWSQVSETQGEPISIVRLTDELAARSIERVSLWKLDVEGYEIPALDGAEDILRDQRCDALYVELVGENRARVRDYLGKFGYRYHSFDRRGHVFRASELPS